MALLWRLWRQASALWGRWASAGALPNLITMLYNLLLFHTTAGWTWTSSGPPCAAFPADALGFCRNPSSSHDPGSVISWSCVREPICTTLYFSTRFCDLPALSYMESQRQGEERWHSHSDESGRAWREGAGLGCMWIATQRLCTGESSLNAVAYVRFTSCA